jgi:DNA-binding transcriptional ArsR family regulator
MADRDVVSERTIELTDPRAMRALAHPVRMALLGLLRNHGPMTASQAAARLGESSGTCSFHFRQLAKYGFCEEAGGGKGREKPWRATATFTSWKSTPSDPDLADAEHHLNLVVVQRYVEQITRWLANRRRDEPEWQEAFGFGDVALPLTAAELAALRRDVEALVRPYVARITGEAETPEGTRRVNFVHFEFPEPEDAP